MYDVITIGTATHDIFLRSPLFKGVRDKSLEKMGIVNSEAQCFSLGAKIEIEKPIETVGGGAANAAVTFARWGLKTGALVQIGNDQNGKAVVGKLKKEGVRPLAIVDEKEGTGYSVLLLAPSGERTILHYRGASKDLSLKEISFASLKAKAFYIVPGNIPFPVVRAIIAHAKKCQAFIAMNPSRYYLEHRTELKKTMRDLDVVLVNREEAAYLTGYRFHEEEKIFRRFDEWAPGLAVMTDGPKGVLVSDGVRLYHAPTYKEKKLVSRAGSGDAFGSGFVAGLLMHRKERTEKNIYTREAIEYAIRAGSANATSVVEHVGAQVGIIRKAELNAARFRTLPIKEKQL